MSIDYTSFSDENYLDIVDDAEPEQDFELETIETDSSEFMGVVANTEKVYMREHPDKSSSSVTIMNKGDEVIIDGVETDSFGNEWYHLTNAQGAEGYTMSEFIEAS